MIVVLGLAGCSLISDAELAERFDLDGDGVPRPDDCDDDDANVRGATPGYADVDGDGFGSTAELARCPGAGTDGFATEPGDCDDADASIFPGAAETCNDVDDDCDTVADDGVSVPLWYVDEDGDRFGTTADIVQQCTQPAGYADNPDDCDDADPLVNPDKAWYTDADGDGYGDADAPVHACEQPQGAGVTVGLAGGAVSHWGFCESCDSAGTFVQVSGDSVQTHYCGRAADGSLSCWGSGAYGETTPPSGAGFTDVSMGYYHACAVDGDGGIQCWGDCYSGECTPPV